MTLLGLFFAAFLLIGLLSLYKLFIKNKELSIIEDVCGLITTGIIISLIIGIPIGILLSWLSTIKIF